jgi:hypothetical protein
MTTRIARFAVAAAVAALSLASGHASASEAAGERTIVMLAVQHAMHRHVDRTAFPDTLEQHPDVMALGGYRLDPPNEDGEWYARAYTWHPGTIVVQEGEKVTLEMFGIHGDEHPGMIEGYDIAFNARRGEVTRVTFVADKPGVFQIKCAPHLPSMMAQLVVLPAE